VAKIFLLDTNSFIYRAYHAAAHSKISLSTRAGFPTGAAFIFTKMLKKLMAEHKPEYLVSILDAQGETFRDRLYPGYKANRKGETPNDLIRQIPHIERLLDLYHIPRLRVPDVEADDVIGTLASRYYEENLDNQIYVVTGDKDMFQLVNDRIFIVNPMKDLLADAAKVEEIVGVAPTQVVDVMALRGDAVDNVPGAPGIGKKGSVDIIREFGSLTVALDRAGEVKRKSYREALQNHRPQIELSKKLVTLDREVPVDIKFEDMKLTEPDTIGLAAFYQELEFASLLKNEALYAVEDFAEIVQPDHVPTKADLQTTMSDDEASAAIDAFL